MSLSSGHFYEGRATGVRKGHGLWERKYKGAGHRTKDAPARWRSALPLGTSDASEAGLLSRITSYEKAQVFSTEPRGPYLYVRAATTRACGVWHQVLCGLFAGAHVLQALARHNPSACLELL